ncbi:MAG: energy transducer TonB [Bacteroidaceae bacterium]|nr:energy transducer TonB [Bacteroidaceae bacterium]
MKREKFDIFSVLWTILLHGLAIVLLLVLHLNRPVAQAESGVPVMLGNMGNLDTDYEFTEVNSMPAPAPAAVPVPAAPQAEPAITQNLEETVAIESGEKEKPVKPADTPKQPTPEEIRAEQERQAAEAAQNLMANAFGRSSSMQASAPTENNSDVQGTPGSTEGNSTQGKPSGSAGYGTWDLGGRDMVGELPRPAYNGIQEEGRVVVTITVDPEGNVIDTRINNRTNTTNLQLRNAAVEAARRTKFNATSGSNNQSGTITYYFKLK